VTALRVIFDRSAFHGERFELLKHCGLRDAVARQQITVLLTPVFLNETLTAYGSPKPSGWKEHLNFALDLASGIFRDRADIFREELLMGRGPFARPLVSHSVPRRRRESRRQPLVSQRRRRESPHQQLVAMLREVAGGRSLATEWIETKEARDEAFRKGKNQARLSQEIREEIATKFGASPTPTELAQYPFAQMRKNEGERTGRQLMSIVSAPRAGVLGDQWARAPHRFPFYSAFVDGFMYNGYYAALEHHERIDRNAQADYEQLAYLTWADLMVSNDTRFMRHAFDAIWRPRGKRLETAEGFAALVRTLS